MKKLFGEIEKVQGLRLEIGTNLKKYTTYKLEVVGDIVFCQTVDALKKLIQLLKKNNYAYNIVGWGANQILLNTKDVLLIKLDFEVPKDIFKDPAMKYTLPASTPLNILTSHALKFGLKEWEVFTGIPASLGGAIYMNAGTGLGEICQIIESVDLLKASGEVVRIEGDALRFSYRKNHFVESGDIIIAATLTNKGQDEQVKAKIKDYLQYRKDTQPLNTKNCGCVFKNHSNEVRAGHMVDLLGLKGLMVGGLKVSLKHANFIENIESASSKDFDKMVSLILDELEYTTGIRFELEAKIY